MTVVENIVYAGPLLFMQLISVLLYGLFTDYGEEAVGTTAGSQTSNTIDKYYPFFQDVHVMIFIGFGFLMTFLKKDIVIVLWDIQCIYLHWLFNMVF